MSRQSANPYRDVSPSVLYRAVAGQAEVTEALDRPFKKRDNTLELSVQHSSADERNFGKDVANSALSLRRWCKELEAWQEECKKSSIGVSKQQNGDTSDSSRGDQTQTEQSPATIAAARHGWLQLPDEIALVYQRRINQIRYELGTLDMEKQKAAVLDTHQGYRRLSGNGADGGKQAQLTGLSALITAVILNALQYHNRLLGLIEIWSMRLNVLASVPAFLAGLQVMTETLLEAWKSVQEYHITSNDSESQRNSSDAPPRTREQYEVERLELSQSLAALGKQLDSMLDVLEGREDTLPEQWIDDVDRLEEGFSSWSVSAEAQLVQWEDQVRLEEEIGRTRAEEQPQPREEQVLNDHESDVHLQSSPPLSDFDPPNNLQDAEPLMDMPLARTADGTSIETLENGNPINELDSPYAETLESSPPSSMSALTPNVPEILVYNMFDGRPSFDPSTDIPSDVDSSTVLHEAIAKEPTDITDVVSSPEASEEPVKQDLGLFTSSTVQGAELDDLTHSFSDTDILGAMPGKTATLEKALFVTTGGSKRKILHRRHSSRELDTGLLYPHKVIHRRHSSKEIGIERASFASGFSMSEVKRIEIVRSPSDLFDRGSGFPGMTTDELPTRNRSPESWSVQRWKANKAAQQPSERTSPTLPPISVDREMASSPDGSQGEEIDDSRSNPEPFDDHVESQPDQSMPVLSDTDHALSAVAPSNEPVRVVQPQAYFNGDTATKLERQQQRFDALEAAVRLRTQNLQTPIKNRPSANSPAPSTDDQIERRIDRIISSLPTKIKFDKQPTARTPSRLASASTPKSSPRNSALAPPTVDRSPTPALTLTRAEEPSAPISKTKLQENKIRLYHLVQNGRSAPVKLYVRLVGDEGRVMVRVGGGWEDLEKYLREYSAHHSRAILPDMTDVSVVPAPQRRAFTMPALDNKVIDSSPKSIEKPFEGRPPSRLSKRPAQIFSETGNLQVPKRQSVQDTVARSVSVPMPLEPSVTPEAPTNVEDDESDSSSGPSLARTQLTAERKAWLDGVIAKARKWKADGGSAVQPEPAVPSPLPGPVRRVYRSSGGGLKFLDQET